MILEIVQKLSGLDLLGWIGAVTLLLNGLIAIFLLVPGDQPDKFLQMALDFILKFSRKKVE